MLEFADGWRHMSPTLNFKYCSKRVIGRLSCLKYPERLARILWRGVVCVDRHLCGAQQTQDLTQCCFNIAPPPPRTALDQYWNNIESSPRVSWESCLHFDTRVPSVSGWNRLHSVLCTRHRHHKLQSVIRVIFQGINNTFVCVKTVYSKRFSAWEL